MDTHQAVSRSVRVLMALDQTTQRQLAERLGVSQQAVSARLTGRTPWDVNDLDGIAAAFGVTAVDLLTGAVAGPGTRPAAVGQTHEGPHRNIGEAPQRLPHLDSNQEPADSRCAASNLAHPIDLDAYRRTAQVLAVQAS